VSAPARGSRRAARRLSGALFAASFIGCAYYNGVYNARSAARTGERALRRGDDSAAVTSFAAAAVKAETVLARYPHSRWAPEARYLAGVGYAFAGRCDRASPLLRNYLGQGTAEVSTRRRATLALGSCLARGGAASEALDLLDPPLAELRTAYERTP
jgi:hypothetical protein